jgi:hypothetical protein
VHRAATNRCKELYRLKQLSRLLHHKFPKQEALETEFCAVSTAGRVMLAEYVVWAPVSICDRTRMS